MPVINRIAEFHDEMTGWRRDFHMHPELAFEEHRTAGIVAEKLKEFGVDEVHTGIGRTGVVGVIKGRPGAGTIGLRADMDALPIFEETGADYASRTPGKMHACGHDGHTTMLLGAAKYLAETRNFDGTVYVIFQPAEENFGGGHRRAGGDADPARGQPRPVVQGVHLLGRETLEEAVLDHGLGTGVPLLARLEDAIDGAVEVARLG